MELNSINKKGRWEQIAQDLNENFESIGAAVEQVKNTTSRNKGYFVSLDALNAQVTRPTVGDKAYVGSGSSYTVYQYTSSGWTNTGTASGNEVPNLDNYYTEDEADQIFLGYTREAKEIEDIAPTLVTEALRKTPQTLTDSEKIIARGNIGAASAADVTNLITKVDTNKTETDTKLTELATQVIYDVSANNGGATFSSLSALLSSENLSTLIPSTVRCGGMSIRFVQSSDNKYVQYRLVTNEWSTDTEDWAIADDGVYVENPEFVYVKTDSEGKILWAIRTDGSIYYGAGVPQQIIDYIEEKLAELSLDEYEDIVAFLSDYLGSDTTLKALLDSKLDAEGLDPDALNSVQAIENHEWLNVTTDSEGKVLGGRKTDGTVVENCDVKFNYSSGNVVEVNNELRLSSEAKKKLKEATYGVEGDILTLHPKEVILPLLKTFKCRSSWLIPYQNNYRYINFNLLWFSDLHHVGRRLARITKFYNKYKDYIDDVVCSGDSQNTYWEDNSFWQENGGSSYLNVIGNHECLGGDRRDGDKVLLGFNPPNFSQKECYDRFFKDYLSDTGITIQENKSYWYKDYTLPERDSSGDVVEGAYAYKIRIIGVDHYHWKEQKVYSDGTPVEHYPDGQPVDTGEQQTWLRNLLEDARENDFSVICIEHNPVAKSNFDEADTPFQCKDPYYTDVDPIKTEILDEVQTFIDNGGKFITWLTGHTHDDRFGTITSHPGQLMITIGTAGNYIQEAGSQWEFPSFYDRTEDTINDDLFNIVSINVYGGTISMYRVGCNYDKHGRHIDSIAYDYINKQIL